MLDKPTLTSTRAARAAPLLALVAACLLSPVTLAQVSGSAPAAPAYVQTKKVGDVAVLSWPAPTLYTDGTTLPAGSALTYTVYQAAPGSTWLVVASGLTTRTYTSHALPKGGTCWILTDTLAGLESAPNGPICLFAGLPANPPGATQVQ